ncbi:uncharacterized protein RCO7_04048 [Rhynchosporium graminicola]|uniref:Cyanovirin-N domain-containing protein n=1 Tax=Rhynchosporium graminicola TaxID=2792576 RepID=A0A1E1LF75_9HELO|nr:uncharacterized protein RCO7_04048 [Rhynchosporium commune]
MRFLIFGVSLMLLRSVSGLLVHQEENEDVFPVSFCDEVKWESNSTGLQAISCIERFEAPSDISNQPALNESCPVSDFQTNSTSSDEIIHSLGARSSPKNNDAMQKARYACNNRELPYRSQILPTSDGNHKKWCFREGAIPKYSDVTKLCAQAGKGFDSTISLRRLFQIQRTKWASKIATQGTCFCILRRYGTAGLKLCNCDRCDALTLDFGVEDMCLALWQGCIAEGFASGYQRTKYPNALYALYGHKDNKGGLEQQIELDPVLELDGVMNSSCNSGDESRRDQDYTGTVIACEMNSWSNRGCKPKYGKGSWWTFWRNFNPSQ